MLRSIEFFPTAMLILHVSQPLKPAVPPLVGRFAGHGGTIGRGTDCTLVLPDPDKHISRAQAEIRFSSGQYTLLSRSAVNPLVWNGRTLSLNEAQVLGHGDEITIAHFVLRVELLTTDAQAPAGRGLDPFDDLIPKTLVAGAAARGGTPSGAHVGSALGNHYIPEDAFADLAKFAPPPESEPVALAPSARRTDHQPIQPGRHSANTGGASPPWLPDPFELERGEAPRSQDPLQASAAKDPLGLGEFDKPRESIDDLFSLGSTNVDPLAAGSPLAEPALGDARGLSAPGAMPDQVPEIHAAVRLPTFEADPPAAQAGQQYRSWDNPEEISRTHVVGGHRRHALSDRSGEPPVLSPKALAEIAELSADAHRLDFEPPPKTRTTAMLDDLNRQALSAAGASRPDQDRGSALVQDEAQFALIKAFLLGAGLSELPRVSGAAGPRVLDAATMQQIGELLRLFTEGTSALLAARTMTKQEMHAEVTVIVARNNNPMKFSPDSAGALAHLLTSRPMRGFMDGRSAVRDAFDDLNAHQIGVVAGMRAAMQGLIARFDPQELEKRLKQKSVLDAMLPMNRKAKLWELFNELFGELAREAEDDFEALFGREFLRAYEAQIDQIDRKEH